MTSCDTDKRLVYNFKNKLIKFQFMRIIGHSRYVKLKTNLIKLQNLKENQTFNKSNKKYYLIKMGNTLLEGVCIRLT